MEERYVALAIPFFLLLMGIELAALRWQKGPGYRFQDSITNLSCGIGQQVLEPFFRTIGLAGYIAIYTHYRVATIPVSSVWGWIALLFGVDLGYYVFHRASHRVNFLWASHAVHHQSEEYNLSVALRQSWIEVIFHPAFYLPLAAIGFSPAAFVAMTTLNTLYQFWIHTRAVKRVGVLEWFLNTPSHHRVHHGIDPKYIDKNYAGVFIIWDRLFGTFQIEEEEPVYGTVKPLASYNPLWANAQYWVELATMARTTRLFRDKMRVWIAPPEWRPSDLSGGVGYVTIPEVDRASYRKYDIDIARGIVAYVAISFVIVAAGTMAFLWFAEGAPLALLVVCAVSILASVVTWGGLFEGKRWAVPVEMSRLIVAALAFAWLTRNHDGGIVMASCWAAVSAAMIVWVSRYRSPRGEKAVVWSRGVPDRRPPANA